MLLAEQEYNNIIAANHVKYQLSTYNVHVHACTFMYKTRKLQFMSSLLLTVNTAEPPQGKEYQPFGTQGSKVHDSNCKIYLQNDRAFMYLYSLRSID